MRRVTIALLLAAIWSAGLIVAAAVAPAYQSSSASSSASLSPTGETVTVVSPGDNETATLLEENGPRVLVLVGIPLVGVAIVGGALYRRRAHARSGAGPLAWTVVGLLGAFAVLGLMTIGIFILPTVGLLVFACGSASASAPLTPSIP